MPASDTRPLASVLTQIVSEVAYLLQTEIRLAKAEASEKLGQAARGGAMLGIAAVLLLPGLFLLMVAAVRWLEVAGMPTQWGYLLVGGIVVAIGVGLALKGMHNLKGSELVPERTIKQVRADFAVAKEKVT
jgi:hypothetical protein